MMYNKGNKFIADFVSRTKKNDEIVKNNDGYEVTQLINSLIGLLIIPEQTMYRQITDDSVDDKLLVKLISCINKNTYKPKKEDLQAITRHMRNAVAHSKISFKSEKGKKDISSGI